VTILIIGRRGQPAAGGRHTAHGRDGLKAPPWRTLDGTAGLGYRRIMSQPAPTLTAAAVTVLTAADPAEKCRLTQAHAQAWRDGAITAIGTVPPPARPARPAHPALRPPREMPKRSTGPGKGRLGLLHALAHIELNAIDLAWDLIARFAAEAPPRAFHDDWVQVAADEADHFQRLEADLHRLGSHYGALPAHDGLWQAAEQTAGSLAARLAIVPCTHEARGLDTTPATLDRLRAAGETAIAETLAVIYRDEITHVRAGTRWLRWLAERDGVAAHTLFHREIARHYKGGLKPPFNEAARAEAGMPREWYAPLARA
jgi:uncharacterized ferritin-like protein (DUF455 family)